MDDIADLRAAVAEACRILGILDATSGTYGHVSVRLPDRDTMLIRGKGRGEVGLRYTSDDDVIEVDLSANKRAGSDDLQPPSESFIHTWLYRERPDVRSVVHVHPEHAVLLSVCDKQIIPIVLPGSWLVLDGVPVFPRAITIHDDELGRRFAATMGDAAVCLMKGHGVTVVGTSVEEATVRTLEFVEFTSLLYHAYLLGEPTPLSDEDREFVRAVRRETGRPRGTPGGSETVMNQWRYYATLATDTSGLRAGEARRAQD